MFTARWDLVGIRKVRKTSKRKIIREGRFSNIDRLSFTPYTVNNLFFKNGTKTVE